MLRNKMKLAGIVIGVGLFLIFYGIKLSLWRLEESARLDFENGQFCGSFETSLIISPYVKNASYRIGNSYAAGLCVKQNFEEAKRWFLVDQDGDESKIAALFFYAAGDLIDISGSTPNPEAHSKILAAIQKSLELGFVPQEKDLQEPELKQYIEEAKLNK